MNKFSFLISILLAFLLAGCAGGTKTTDPRKGGLFSYNPDAYNKRLEDRRRERGQIEQDTVRQKQKTSYLQKNLASEKQQLAVLNRNLTYLDNSLNTIQQRINRSPSTAQTNARKLQIASKIKKNKKDIWRMQRNIGGDMGYAAKQREYNRLKKERDLLVKEAELLERM